jgi:protein-tyrosine phosphatase
MTNVASPYRLLFVCLGNICRSPAAENIMNHLLNNADLDGRVWCDSAGTSSYHRGSLPDRRMTTAAQQRGIAMRGFSRQFNYSDFEQFDLILAMDRSNYSDILALDFKRQYHDRVRLMCDFCTRYSTQEVPDPYYGGVEGFNQVLDLLTDACEGLLQHLMDQKLVIKT